jgi:hypothetical protein
MLFRRFHLQIPIAIIFLCILSAAQNAPARPRNAHPPRPAVSTPAVAVSPGSWSQFAKLTVKGFSETLGDSVAISGDTVVAGQNPTRSKLAYVFLGSSSGWNNTLPVAALASPPSAERFYAFVAIDGDTIVIGSPAFESNGPGYVYVYVKPASGWKNMYPTATLMPSGTNDGFFGTSVAISGDTIVVGDTSYNTPGTAYVFVKPASGWTNMTETAQLTASSGQTIDEFSESVSVSGNTVAVGAPGADGSTGKTFVFVEPASGWTNMTQTATLVASDAEKDARVGNSVSISGNNVLVGAPNPGNAIPGVAYVFTKPSAGWANMAQTAELSAADGIAFNFFGGSVSISGSTAIVGAPFRGTSPNEDQGGIYVFQEPAGGWQSTTSSTVLTGSDVHRDATLGTAICISGNTLVAGSESFVLNAAYVFGLQ